MEYIEPFQSTISIPQDFIWESTTYRFMSCIFTGTRMTSPWFLGCKTQTSLFITPCKYTLLLCLINMQVMLKYLKSMKHWCCLAFWFSYHRINLFSCSPNSCKMLQSNVNYRISLPQKFIDENLQIDSSLSPPPVLPGCCCCCQKGWPILFLSYIPSS